VVRVKRVPQTDPSPAIPPEELMQPDTTSARELIFDVGTNVPAGTLRPGADPVEVLAKADADAKAVVRVEASSLPDPTSLGEVINGERADTAVTVVTSLMTINVEGVSESQRPIALIISRAELIVPGARPGFPPEATM
jgi:hypothetical protein